MIYKYLFEEIYDFAGQMRKVNISKGDFRFAPVMYLEAALWLDLILKKELHKVVDWSKVDKEDYLLAMERSPIRNIEIKHVLYEVLTDEIDSREVYMKGIDHSYYYEGYNIFKAEDL